MIAWLARPSANRSLWVDASRTRDPLTSALWELLMRRDLDDVIQGWPYDPEPGEVLAREVRARDGRSVLQIRVELGVLQLEMTGRPDGTRPHGFATYLDYLRYCAASRGQAPGGKSPPWTMDQEHCTDADREFIQFYHRRMAWLSLRKYDKAMLDADHTIALMDFVRRHGTDEDYVASHEQFRGLVQFIAPRPRPWSPSNAAGPKRPSTPSGRAWNGCRHISGPGGTPAIKTRASRPIPR